MSKTKFEEFHANLNSKISNIWHQNLETIYLHLFTPFNRFNCSEDFSLSTFLNLSILGPRALARARCAHVPHLSAPARLLGSWVIGVVLKVQHGQHLG